MSDSLPQNVHLFDNSDPQMQRAYEAARANFRYFWREVAWERRRIVPALRLAYVKVPFHHAERAARGEEPHTEHMWIGDVDFDGRTVSGVLGNSPNWLKNVKMGDSGSFPLGKISDWMYAIDGTVFGAFTVNVLRSRMSPQEREKYDEAWGLDFGDPEDVRVVSELMIARHNPEEHAMSENAGPSFREQLEKDRSLARVTDDKGWTFLHQ